MSYQEKKTLVSIITGSILLVIYCFYTVGKVNTGAVDINDMQFWAITMLIFIGIGIVSGIILQILFHIFFSITVAIKNKIAGEPVDDKTIERIIKIEIKEDERDHQIELKSMRFGFAFAGIGFVASLIVLSINGSSAIMLNILYLSFFVGSIFEGFVQLILYKKGR